MKKSSIPPSANQQRSSDSLNFIRSESFHCLVNISLMNSYESVASKSVCDGFEKCLHYFPKSLNKDPNISHGVTNKKKYLYIF